VLPVLKRVRVICEQNVFTNKDLDKSGTLNSYELRSALHEIGNYLSGEGYAMIMACLSVCWARKIWVSLGQSARILDAD